MSKKIDIEDEIKKLKTIMPDFKVTLQDLRQPTKEFLLSYLERFFYEIGENPELQMQKLRSDPMYDTLIPVITYCNMLKTLFKGMSHLSTFVDQLMIGMFLKPQPKYTQILFSITTNYMCFYLKQKKFQVSLAKEFDAIAVQQQQVDIEKNNLVESKNSLASFKTEAQLKIKDLEPQNESMLLKLNEYKEKEEVLVKELDKMRVELAEHDEQVTYNHFFFRLFIFKHVVCKIKTNLFVYFNVIFLNLRRLAPMSKLVSENIIS